MGQKVNPISFRSSKNTSLQLNKWYYEINNANYGILAHQDIEIKKLLINFLNLKKIYVHEISIKRYLNDLIIDIQIFNLKKKKELNRFKKSHKLKYKNKFKNKSKKNLRHFFTKKKRLNSKTFYSKKDPILSCNGDGYTYSYSYNKGVNIHNNDINIHNKHANTHNQKYMQFFFNKNKIDLDFNNFKKIKILNKTYSNVFHTKKLLYPKIKSLHKKKFKILTSTQKVYKYKKYLIFLLKKNLKLNPYIVLNLNINYLDKKKSQARIFQLNKSVLIKNYFLRKKKHISSNKILYFKNRRLQKELLTQAKTKLFKLKNFKNFENILKLLNIIFIFKSSEMLVQYVINNLKVETKKRQYRFFITLKTFLATFFLLHNKTISGLKLQIKGKFNNASRSQTKVISLGNTPLQCLKTQINYSFNDLVTKEGSFGIKVWFFYK